MSGVVGFAFVDHTTWTVIRCNAQFARILGYEESELEGKSLEDIYHNSDAGTYREVLHRVLTGEDDCMDSVKRFMTKAGSSVVCRSICHPLRYQGDVVVMLKQICVIADDKLLAESIALRDAVSQLERDLYNLRGDVRALVGRGNDVNIGSSSIRSGATTNDPSIFRWIVVAIIAIVSVVAYIAYIGGWSLHHGGAKPPQTIEIPHDIGQGK